MREENQNHFFFEPNFYDRLLIQSVRKKDVKKFYKTSLRRREFDKLFIDRRYPVETNCFQCWNESEVILTRL